jgi:hypothetical protein
MNTKYVKDPVVSRQILGTIICQEIREFEIMTKLRVTGFKIIRNKETVEDYIENVSVKVDFPD